MKRTPRTKELIQRLYQSHGSRAHVALLSEIGDSNEPAAIVDILPFIHKKGEVAVAAADALHKLLQGTSPNDLAWLDAAVRRNSMYGNSDAYDWYNAPAKKIEELERFGNASFSLIALASFHFSGYAREAAVRKLSQITTGAEVPFLIVRLNEWVRSIRDDAYEAIRARIKPEYCRAFIKNLTLISRLEYAERSDHKEIVNSIYRLLQSDECRTALLESLNSEDRFSRRASYTLALDQPKSDVVTTALNDDDTLIRRWAAEKVSTAFEGETLEHFVQRMKRDRYMPVRREALRIAIKVNPDHAIEELQNALLDTHHAIREESRYVLQKLHPLDVAAFYRAHLQPGPTLYSAISGLGESGWTGDDDLLVAYATYPSSKIRSATIRALTKLNRGAHVPIFMHALKDEVPNVSGQAVRALIKKGSLLSPDAAWEIFKSASQPHVKRNALSIIEKLGKWDSIPLLIRALSDVDADARSAIARWLGRFNRSFSSPTRGQLRLLNDALKECDHLLDEETKDELVFSMKGF